MQQIRDYCTNTLKQCMIMPFFVLFLCFLPSICLGMTSNAPNAVITSNNNSEEFSDISIDEDDNVIGCLNAPNTFIEYSSLSCTHCAHWHLEHFDKIKTKYVDTCIIKYIMRTLPTSHASLYATLVASCSDDYFGFVKILFRTQETWAYNKDYKQILLNMAKLRGRNYEALTECVDKGSKLVSIKRKSLHATQVLGITYTPTFILNGKIMVGATNDSSIGELLSNKKLLK